MVQRRRGISPDGSMIVISGRPIIEGVDNDWQSSTVYVMPFDGGPLKQVTELVPSFWHGWSIDGGTLAFVGRRNDVFDIYTIPVEGGEEIQLTDSPGLDDGPDYSVDGSYIYYNSYQSGSMEIWRMNVDGTDKLQLTNDNYSNWFPHPSPEGRYLVYLSYVEDQQEEQRPHEEPHRSGVGSSPAVVTDEEHR